MSVESGAMTHAQDADAEEALWARRRDIMTMRNSGRTVAEIQQVLARQQPPVRVSMSTIRNDVAAALKAAVAESAEDMVARQRTVLFDLRRANYVAALDGNKDATRAIMAGLEHEARLFGLYAPTRVDIGVNDFEFASDAVSLITDLGLEAPKELTDILRSGSTERGGGGALPVGGRAAGARCDARPPTSPDETRPTLNPLAVDRVRPGGAAEADAEADAEVEPPSSQTDAWSNL